MRAHFPRGYELIFDNYNALVSAKQRPRRPAAPVRKKPAKAR
jgi:hypothetical protein